jgi:hypothetical protein
MTFRPLPARSLRKQELARHEENGSTDVLVAQGNGGLGIRTAPSSASEIAKGESLERRNGLELSCPPTQATDAILAQSGGHGMSDFPDASRVSSSERLCEAQKSRIAFPLEARIARLQCTLAPLPGQSAQALRDRSPPARLFTQSGELFGSR